MYDALTATFKPERGQGTILGVAAVLDLRGCPRNWCRSGHPRHTTDFSSLKALDAAPLYVEVDDMLLDAFDACTEVCQAPPRHRAVSLCLRYRNVTEPPAFTELSSVQGQVPGEIMNTLSSTLCAALALSFAAATAVPVAAAPAFVPRLPAANSDTVVDIQFRRDRGERSNRFERRGNGAYLNGKRGYRNWRRGYREHNGFWFPSGAFITGLIIGGSLNDRPMLRSGSSHVEWCADRWRSYDRYSDTYQPSNGPRRVCVSPYS